MELASFAGAKTFAGDLKTVVFTVVAVNAPQLVQCGHPPVRCACVLYVCACVYGTGPVGDVGDSDDSDHY